MSDTAVETTMDLSQDFGNVSKPEESGKKDYRFISEIPGPDNPLIVKLLPNPYNPKTGYIPMDYYTFKVGPNDKDYRSRPSLQSLGMIDKDPEAEKKFEYVKQLSNFKKDGLTKDSPKWKAVKAAMSIYEAKSMGWVHIIEPGKAEIRCLKLRTAMIQTLFGREGGGNIKPIPSLLEALGKKGKSPYGITREDCWLKIYKTGVGIATEYHIEPCQTNEMRVLDGVEVEVKAFQSFPVAASLKNAKLKPSDLPNPIEFEKKNAFTLEETQTFIESSGTIFPERFAARAKTNNDAEQTPVSTTAVVTAETEYNMDDIPF
jgi:hypothetical protein